MRKIVLALLVLLLAVPAMATVEVRCAQVSDTKEVIVTYDVDDGNNFRAFGIKISVDNGASISDIDVNDADYYIFPGSIDINEAGDVNDWGSPIAAQDSNSFILEMGSLYKVGSDEDHNTVPPTSGQLCSFMVSGDCNVAIANDAARGGVVMEDLDFAGSIDLVGCQVTIVECYQGPEYDQWVAVGKPDGWCGSIIPRQCHGDADNRSQGKGNYWVSTWDLDVLVAAWNKAYGAIGANTVTVGIPELAVPLINADFDHLPQGKGAYRVSTWDLDILVANWNKVNLPDPNCP